MSRPVRVVIDSLLQAAYEQAPVGIFLARASGQLLSFNTAFLSVSPASRPGDDIAVVFVDQGIWSSCATALAQGAEYRVETQLRAHDGTARGVEVRVRRLDAAGSDQDIRVGTVRFLDSGLPATIALEKSEARWRSLLAACPDGIIVHRQGRITWLNDAAVALLGVPSAEAAIGRNQLDFVAPEFHATIHQRRTDLAHGRIAAPRLEEELVRPDGSRLPVEAVAARLEDADGPGVLLILRNISARREQARRVERLSRIRAMLSSSSAMVLRARSRDTLLREICRVAVEQGGYALGQISLRSADGDVRVATGCCQREARSTPSVAEEALLQELAQLTLASGVPAVRQEVPLAATDGGLDEPALHSAAAVPFGEGASRGVFALVAERPHAFDGDELDLLGQMGAELAFALEGFARDEQLDFMAYHDPLTGLANRALLLDRLEQLCAAKPLVAVGYFDIRGFRAINEYLGRTGGDTLLRALAERLVRGFPTHATVARIGSNAFAVAWSDFSTVEELASSLERVRRDELDRDFLIDDEKLAVTIHAGISLYPHDGAGGEALLRNAEAAWGTAAERQEPYVFYAKEMNAWVAERLALENELRRAVNNGEFAVHYQPRVALADGELIGVEALLRWNHPTRGVLTAGGFVGLLEQSGLIHQVGRWVFRTVVEDWRRWRARGWLAPRVAVNVSALQLRRAGFANEVRVLLDGGSNERAELDLEITESVFLHDLQGTIATLDELRAHGLRIAIDDFGTGYSSLSYLARLPIDIVKVDKGFVSELGAGRSSVAIVAAIIQLARALGLKSVAEGVETPEQARELLGAGCEEVQGFLIAAALPVDALEALLADQESRRRLVAALAP